MKKNKFTFIIIIALVILFLSITLASSQSFSFRTTYNLDVHKNGSATWGIEYRVPLNSEEEINDFEQYMENFSKIKEERLSVFINDTQRIIEQAESETGREMEGKSFEVEVDKIESITGGGLGEISYKFLWTNFSEKQGDELKIGDVFVGGLTLGENDSLSIQHPTNYSVESVNPTPNQTEATELVWLGPKQFNPQKPSVVLSWEPSNGGQKPPSGEGDLPLILMISIFVALLFVLIGYYYKFGLGSDEDTKEIEKSDEQLIIDLIRENDGELYQSEVVKKTGFSKAKVSNLLKSLNEKDKITKIQKGRKNLIRLN